MTPQKDQYSQNMNDTGKDFVMLENEACEVTKIPGDGNCLFGAISHQLYGYRIGSTMHTSMTRTLREMVVEYMQHHCDNVELQMLANTRIETEFPGLEGTTDSESVINLSHAVAQNDTWGDSESFFALCRIFPIKIILRRENGHSATVEDETGCPVRTIYLVYRGPTEDWNHYDSFYRYDTLTGPFSFPNQGQDNDATTLSIVMYKRPDRMETVYSQLLYIKCSNAQWEALSIVNI